MSYPHLYHEPLGNGKYRRMTSPEYRLWQAIKNKCYNKNTHDYKYYGAKDIQVHAEWRSDFYVFLAYVGLRPSPELTLDRIKTEGNYEPGNVRWATRLTQARNRSYAKKQSWVLAQKLGCSSAVALNAIWQVERKLAGNPPPFYDIGLKREAAVIEHLKGI